MKAKHVFGGHVYLINNFGVALNPIFKDQQDLDFFREKFNHYLGSICDLIASSHQINQFQYLIKIKERPILEAFYRAKKKAKRKNTAHDLYDLSSEDIPESYLIFSQEVSNWLNSVAKKFNFRHDRKGGLFGARYGKELIESEDELNRWKERLLALEPLVLFSENWTVQLLKEGKCKELEMAEEVDINGAKIDLRGCFEYLPPLTIKSPLFVIKFLNYFKTFDKNPTW